MDMNKIKTTLSLAKVSTDINFIAAKIQPKFCH